MSVLRTFCQRYRNQATVTGLVLLMILGPISFHSWSFHQKAKSVQGKITRWKPYTVKSPPANVYRVYPISQNWKYWIWVEYLDDRGDLHSKRFVGRRSDQIGQLVTVEYRSTDPTSARLARNRIDNRPNGFWVLSLLCLAMGATGHWSKRRNSQQKAEAI